MELLSLKNQLTGRILIVEDNALVRSLLQEVLSQQGHSVQTSENGDDAQRRVANEIFDLIITDIHLPGLSGLDLITRFKAFQPTVAILVITGYPSLSKAVAAIKQGAADFITKPFNIRHICDLVQQTLLERRQLTESLLADRASRTVIEKLNHQLNQKASQLTRLYAVSESFQSYEDNQSLFQHIVQLTAELTNARRVSLMSFDPTRRHLVIRAAIGLPDEVRQTTCVEMGQGVAGRVARQARLLRVTSRDQRAPRPQPNLRSYLSQSWLSVPLFIGGELFGVLNLTDKNDNSDFTEEDELLVLMLVEKAGIKIENNALYEGIYSNLLDTLKTLVSTIEAKDPYTRYHSQRVTEVAIALAHCVGCSNEDCESIAFAGVLHDIGKIGIEDRILLKPGILTVEEYRIIKKHPVISDTILQPLGLIEAERQIIRHHHERIDGTGYPDGLRDGEISLLSRIVSIADAYDAMTSTRSYRKAMSVEKVLEELRQHGGKQFDASLVEAMAEGIHSGAIETRLPLGESGEEVASNTPGNHSAEADCLSRTNVDSSILFSFRELKK